jgi:hypothetical protein
MQVLSSSGIWWRWQFGYINEGNIHVRDCRGLQVQVRVDALCGDMAIYWALAYLVKWRAWQEYLVLETIKPAFEWKSIYLYYFQQCKDQVTSLDSESLGFEHRSQLCQKVDFVPICTAGNSLKDKPWLDFSFEIRQVLSSDKEVFYESGWEVLDISDKYHSSRFSILRKSISRQSSLKVS